MTEIRSLSPVRDKSAFLPLLDAGGIRLADDLDALLGVYVDDALVGCAGRRGNVIECAAVSPEARGEGLLGTLVSRLLTDIRGEGYDGAFVFTKPAASAQFVSLGFYELARADEAVLLYSRRDGPARFAASLPRAAGAPVGCIVMNANPFTNGHRYLVEQAAAQCGALYVFVVEHDASRFPFADRLRLVRAGTADIGTATVVSGGPFIISAATFPSYFLKRASDASRVHAQLDAALFASSLAPALSITKRFVGSEPIDALTRQYNEALLAELPPRGVAVTVVERLVKGGAPVSASRVRALFAEGRIDELVSLVPPTTLQYLKELTQHES